MRFRRPALLHRPIFALLLLPGGAVAQLPVPAAGVPVVRYPSGALPPATWSIGEATLRLGGASATGAASFVDVVGVLFVDGDGVLVGDGQSSELRLFAFPGGQHIRTMGRRGQGPGEIGDLWRVWRTPSGLVAEDAAGKASVFSLDGRFVRSIPRGIDNGARRVERLDMFDDTLALSRIPEAVSALSVGEAAMSYVRLLAVTPASSRVIARYPQQSMVRSSSGRVRAAVFAAQAVAGVVNGRACVGYPVSYVIDCYTPLGKHMLRIERVGVMAERVSIAHREDFFASETAANPGPRGAPYVSRLRSETRFADVMPLFGEFIAATNGDLWIGPYVPVGPIPMKRPYPQRSAAWSVFGADGKWKAHVQLPARFQLFAIANSPVSANRDRAAWRSPSQRSIRPKPPEVALGIEASEISRTVVRITKCNRDARSRRNHTLIQLVHLRGALHHDVHAPFARPVRRHVALLERTHHDTGAAKPHFGVRHRVVGSVVHVSGIGVKCVHQPRNSSVGVRVRQTGNRIRVAGGARSIRHERLSGKGAGSVMPAACTRGPSPSWKKVTQADSGRLGELGYRCAAL